MTQPKHRYALQTATADAIEDKKKQKYQDPFKPGMAFRLVVNVRFMRLFHVPYVQVSAFASEPRSRVVFLRVRTFTGGRYVKRYLCNFRECGVRVSKSRYCIHHQCAVVE